MNNDFGSDDFGEILMGAVDIHIHSGPDIFPRSVTALEAVEAAKRAGMAAILLKSHSTDTAARAEMVRDLTGFPVFGGVTLNYPVGGLNPHAVVESARQGGRCVWFPSINAKNFIPRAHFAPMLQKAIPRGVRGLAASHRGRLLPAVDRILDIVAEHRLLLAAGHLAPDDTGILFTEARKRGITRMVVNHAEAVFMNTTIEDMRDLARLGAYIEITKVGPIERRAEIIRAVGAQHCLLATDAGPVSDPTPTRLLAGIISGLATHGFTRAELRYLSVEVPSYLLGLEGWEDCPKPPLAAPPSKAATGRE